MKYITVNDDYNLSKYFSPPSPNIRDIFSKTSSSPRGGRNQHHSSLPPSAKVIDWHRRHVPLRCKTECHARKHLAATKRRGIVAELLPSTLERGEHDAEVPSSPRPLSKSDTRYAAKRGDTPEWVRLSATRRGVEESTMDRGGRWGLEKYNEAWSVWTILLEKPRACEV